MNKHSHEHQHSGSHRREHQKHASAGWRPHRDWRVWVVALMLLAILVYVMTLNESIWPGGDASAVPDAPAPAGAP